MENIRRQWNLDCITVRKILKYCPANRCSKSRNSIKIACLRRIFWTAHRLQNIEQKLANQGEVLRWGISCIYLSLWNKWETCHRAINSQLINLKTTLEKYFWFHWNCKQLRVAASNSMSNFVIYFPLFSETIHASLKKRLQLCLCWCRF